MREKKTKMMRPCIPKKKVVERKDFIKYSLTKFCGKN